MASRALRYAFLVRGLEEARRFHVDLLGCRDGRRAPTWIDIELFGNQLSCHLGTPPATANVGQVDDIFEDHDQLAARLAAAAGVAFVVTPRIRYAGEPGEQGTFFSLDPSGNALELEAVRRAGEVFAR